MKYVFIIILVHISYIINSQTIHDSCEVNVETMTSPSKWYTYAKSLKLTSIEKLNQNKINVILNESSDSCSRAFEIINLTNKNVYFMAQDGNIQAIKEAKNRFGTWRPIEYWIPSWCENSYYGEIIKSGESIKFETLKYNGNFKTKIRLKIKLHDRVVYSKSYNGNINVGQFKKPKEREMITFF